MLEICHRISRFVLYSLGGIYGIVGSIEGDTTMMLRACVALLIVAADKFDEK